MATPGSTPTSPQLHRRNALIFLLVGVAYGLGLRWMAGHRWFDSFTVMSFGFIFLMPLAVGFIPVFLAEQRSRVSPWTWIFFPWFSVSIALLGTMIAAWEGFICIAMFAPVGWVCGSIGGVLGGATARALRSRSAQTGTLAFVVMLPFVVSPLTQKLLRSEQIQLVETQIDIHASKEVVWHNIERVPMIAAGELHPSWSRRIGFPAPEEATLSFEGVGAVRHATFAGGVLFVETVDTWEPTRRLAFSIHADTDRIPKTTLDEHVRIGGPYFDVLHGDYEIESLPGGVTRLHLSSRHRVSTDFNWYAHLWTDAVMRDIQNNILYVIKNRCEKQM